jgi:hypothetical protein
MPERFSPLGRPRVMATAPNPVTDRFIEVSGIRRRPNLDHAFTMAHDPSFFTAVETWLLEQPGKSASSTSRARRPVTPDLALATLNRIRRVRWAIARGRGHTDNVSRYKWACRRINQLLGYEITDGPQAKCRIGSFRYVQPRQHAVLGHSTLILEQMRRVDRTIRKWLTLEFGDMRVSLFRASEEVLGNRPWRVRSAARMYEMEVQKHDG